MSSPGWSLNGNQLTTSDNVGVGTGAPAATLDVGGGLLHVGGTTTPTTTAQGAYLGWNALTGSTGETDFINNQGLGSGGFAFMNTAASGSPRTTLMVITGAGNVGIGTTSPQKPLDVAASGGIRIGQTGEATSTNEIYFADNGQIRSLDDNHRIIFNRANNELELREYGMITFSSAATSGQRMAQVVLGADGNLYVNNKLGIALDENDIVRGGEPSSPLVVHGNVEVLGNGNVSVSGDVLLTGADCAEHFDFNGNLPEAGTVVVIDNAGALRESHQAYDKKVAGVVSGAGEYRHGLILDKRASDEGRIPVALVGKVFCKVDAQYSPIEIGDLLTTSSTPGHAMKATEPQKAFGAVIGKALKSISNGTGLIPILVALQ
jgi:hypothetical protein